jgi:hypothetical protein
MVLQNVPDACLIDDRVAVDQDVSECDDLVGICNLTRDPWVRSLQLIQRFTNDLELSFDRRLNEWRSCITVIIYALNKLDYRVGRIPNIPQEASRITPHRQLRVSG